MITIRNKHQIISIAAGVIVFIAMLMMLISLIQARADNAVNARHLSLMQSVSHMTEFMKFSIERPVLLLKGYEVYIASYPEMTQEDTENYLGNLIGDETLIKNVGIIKDSTIVFTYPKEGNITAVGTDLNNIPAQKDAFNKVKITMKPLFFGPIDLIQGGRGYIARTPVAVDGKYWGQVSVVLKEDEVNKMLQNYARELNLEIALFQGNPSKETILFGDIGILEENPIINTVSLMGSRYVIAARGIEDDLILGSYNIFYFFSFAFSLLLAIVVYLGFMKTSDIRLRASRDELTQLHNRSHLETFLDATFRRARNNGTQIGILVMDIDNFKNTNDTYGHLAGDAVLQTLSMALQSTCRKSETVFRMGGDEFLIVFQDISDKGSIEAIANRVIAGIPSMVKHKENDIPLTVSAGYALYPEDGEEFDVLFKYADDQMYENKKGKQQTT